MPKGSLVQSIPYQKFILLFLYSSLICILIMKEVSLKKSESIITVWECYVGKVLERVCYYLIRSNVIEILIAIKRGY